MFEIIQNGDIHALGDYVIIRVMITLICWLFMICSTLVDFWSGVTTAKAMHEPLMSHGFRRTLTKIGSYWQVLIFALMFDILGALISFYYLPFMTMVCTLAIIIIEARSVIENSQRRRTSASQIPDVAKQIIDAATNEEAMAALTRVLRMAKGNDKHGSEYGSDNR